MSTTVYNQVLIYTAGEQGRQWRERKCPIFETVTKGDSNPGSLDCESGILPLGYRAPCGLSYAGMAALLSACLIFCCCSQRFIFSVLDMLVQGRAYRFLSVQLQFPPSTCQCCQPSCLSCRHIFIAGGGGRWLSYPVPGHCRMCLGCDHPPHVGHAPTITVCVG